MHQSLHDMWAACANGHDSSRDFDSDEARALAQAVENSIDRREPAPGLRKIAGNWGAIHSSPEAVVSGVTSLREAASSLVRTGLREGDEATEHLERLLAVFDDVLLGAVEGVSSSLREAALTDPLTGCANRRALEADLERSIASARRTGLDISIAVIDLDGLKGINDTHGHAAGDATLRALAQSLAEAVRRTDAVYRVGGDEFVVLVPFSARTGAAALMKRAQEKGAPSFSWGVASLSMLDPGCGPDDLVALADASLYASRRNLRTEIRARPNRHRIVLAVVGLALAGVTGLTAYDRSSVKPPEAGVTPPVHVRIRPAPSSDKASKLTGKRETRSHDVTPVTPVYGSGLIQTGTPTATLTGGTAQSPGPILTVTLTRITPVKTHVTAVKPTPEPPVRIPVPPVQRVRVTRRWPCSPCPPLPPWTPPVGIREPERHRCGIGGIHVFQRGPHHPVDLRFGDTPHRQFPNEEHGIFGT
jgi:diguanylate cyclase (GGDEF)-like protein